MESAKAQVRPGSCPCSSGVDLNADSGVGHLDLHALHNLPRMRSADAFFTQATEDRSDGENALLFQLTMRYQLAGTWAFRRGSNSCSDFLENTPGYVGEGIVK